MNEQGQPGRDTGFGSQEHTLPLMLPENGFLVFEARKNRHTEGPLKHACLMRPVFFHVLEGENNREGESIVQPHSFPLRNIRKTHYFTC